MRCAQFISRVRCNDNESKISSLEPCNFIFYLNRVLSYTSLTKAKKYMMA